MLNARRPATLQESLWKVCVGGQKLHMEDQLHVHWEGPRKRIGRLALGPPVEPK
eukprot:CAMPEP_0204592178 /NCGR_PEP_ID=MMETSP0661-20131031/50782_1 /ASSEMBLY_ACC=CAM_ASM_000606 /TAXON_ID=109239 /ORGANISM="Alexandrium margalefi, Strain AMGDE01CS-322" /LENGTH=53 /DNA_ID=CAMNT_0051602369 /DNA_START=324 /DNA_END=482 /DNA_ORIENTATION=+